MRSAVVINSCSNLSDTSRKMADLPFVDPKLRNNALKEIFQELHEKVANTVNVTSIVGMLFSKKVLSANDMEDLNHITHRTERCRRLLILLHKSSSSDAFIHLRQAISEDPTYDFLVQEIDEKCELLLEEMTSKKNEDCVTDHRSQELAVTSVTSVNKELEKERDAVKDELLQLTAKFDVKLMKLEKEVIDTEAERDTAIQQQTSSNIKVKQLEKENNEIRRERDNVKEQLSKLTVDYNIKVEQLEKENNQIRRERDNIKEHLSKLTSDNNNNNSKVEQMEREKTYIIESNEKLVKQLADLNDAIQHTKSGLRFLTTAGKVKLIHSITNEDKPLFGLTTLNNELYVRYLDNTDITVYDTETYSVQRSLQVPRLGGVNDMTSCKRHQCIYIADHVNKVVHRVDNKNTITQWSVNDKPSGLSVNSVCNVLVTCGEVGKVKEFTTDGKLISEISLESSIVHPMHTVELTTGQLVVCHGNVKDALNRVCIVDLSGRVLQSYGGSKGSGRDQLKSPARLAVNGVIFVADLNNRRVLMLSPTLSLIREVVSGLRGPSRMWFDNETGRLYVGDNKYENSKWVSGQVKVYGV